MARNISSRIAKEACKTISLRYNIPKVVVEEIFYQYFRMIADDITKADVEDSDTFLNFNIPMIGKLHVPPNRVEKMRENGFKNSDASNDRRRGK